MRSWWGRNKLYVVIGLLVAALGVEEYQLSVQSRALSNIVTVLAAHDEDLTMHEAILKNHASVMKKIVGYLAKNEETKPE